MEPDEDSKAYLVLELAGPAPALEIALAELQDFGCIGAEETSSPPGLRAYFPTGTDLRRIIATLSETRPELELREAPPLPEHDWLSQWKATLDGFEIGERFYVLPTWKPPVETSRTVLRIDPEQAFGTGTHETTRLCVELLEELVSPGDVVIDVGTGTGILAMVAAHLRAARVLAIEPDEAAAECAMANVARNRLADRVEVVARGQDSYDVLEGDLIVANISKTVLEAAIPRMSAPTIVLSGILGEELDPFVETCQATHALGQTRHAGEWVALVLHPRAAP